MEKNKTLKDIAYEKIKESIMHNDLKPKELITEEKLSNMLDMSRTPIRAAIQMLKQENLIEHIPGKGNLVTELSTSYLLDIFDVRMALETYAVKLAAINRTEEDLIRAREVLNIQKKDTPDDKLFLNIDRDFHLELAKMAKNNLLYHEITRINEAYRRYLYFTNYRYRKQDVIDEHDDLLDLIEKQEANKVRNLMEEHIEGVKLSIIMAINRS